MFDEQFAVDKGGALLAIADDIGVRVWDVATRRCLSENLFADATYDYLLSPGLRPVMVFSDDSKWIVGQDTFAELKVWGWQGSWLGGKIRRILRLGGARGRADAPLHTPDAEGRYASADTPVNSCGR